MVNEYGIYGNLLFSSSLTATQNPERGRRLGNGPAFLDDRCTIRYRWELLVAIRVG